MIGRVLVGGALLLGCGGPPDARGPESRTAVATEASPQDRPIIVVIHAEWCAACRHVAPVVAWLHEEYGDRVTFVDLDVTDAEAERRSALVAGPLGLGSFFARSRGTPGITIFGRERREIRHFTVEGRPGPYRTAVEDALVTFRAR